MFTRLGEYIPHQEMFAFKLCLVFLVVLLSCCETYKILVIFPTPSQSHGILGDGIVRHLLNDGHQVTYITPYKYKPDSPNFRQIDVSRNIEVTPFGVLNLETIIKKEFNVGNHKLFTEMLLNVYNETIRNENVQKLINDPKEQFDVVVGQWMYTELPVGFAAVFNCPFIWTSSMDMHWMILRLVDQPSNPAYTGDVISTNIPPFNFWQRVKELYTQIKVLYLRYTSFNKLEREVYDKLLAPAVSRRGRQPPPYQELQFNGSLVLGNSHVSLGEAVAMPQNYISIGGYHIDDTVQPLSDDLKRIMDNAKNGVIYFSMGSNLKSKDIPKTIKDSLIKMFGELKHTVLWKFEEDLPDTPKNVHILHWAPQLSILSHPNLVAFITHGGLLSTIETIHFGVPIIGIPAFADQFLNVNRAVKKGYALRVDLSYTMADELKAAIEEMTTNPKYAEKAKELSFIYHDRPVSPGKQITHWVKHVVKTRGASHLRSPALNMPFYQRLFLDLLAMIFIIIFTITRLLKCVYCAVCSKNKVESKKKQN